MKINKNALIHSYAQSMGIEAAKDLITKKIKSAALEEKEYYTEEEVAKICGELIKEGGLIRIVAQTLLVQLERKRSEEQALLLDNIENQIWYLTDIETYGVVNKAHAEFFGMEKGNLEGESFYDIVGREEANVCIAGNREVFEKKKQTHTEEWVKNGKGKKRLLSVTRTPKIDDNGNVEYVICAAEDITERKQAEEKIKEYSENLEHTVQERTKELRRALYDTEVSRNKIDAILKSIADGLIVTDIYNRIILMNRAAEDLLGVRFSEVIDRRIDVAIKDETLRNRFKTSLEEREPGYQFDFELPGENSKHPRIIRARTSEIKDKAGNQTGIITLICDVTLEREVDRMKTEFISTASHQLRTPLSVHSKITLHSCSRI